MSKNKPDTSNIVVEDLTEEKEPQAAQPEAESKESPKSSSGKKSSGDFAGNYAELLSHSPGNRRKPPEDRQSTREEGEPDFSSEEIGAPGEAHLPGGGAAEGGRDIEFQRKMVRNYLKLYDRVALKQLCGAIAKEDPKQFGMDEPDMEDILSDDDWVDQVYEMLQNVPRGAYGWMQLTVYTGTSLVQAFNIRTEKKKRGQFEPKQPQPQPADPEHVNENHD